MILAGFGFYRALKPNKIEIGTLPSMLTADEKIATDSLYDDFFFADLDEARIILSIVYVYLDMIYRTNCMRIS